jgi:hypothetical protein
MRGKLPALILAPLLLLGGCDAFFSNVFEGLYTLEVPGAAELETLPVSDLERLAEDPAFFDALAGDSVKEAAVLDNLEDYFNPGDGTVDSPEEQRAAALYAEVLIRTSGADRIVAGLAGYLAGADGFVQFESDPGPALAELFGESLPTLAEIEAMVTALDAAWVAYAAIGDGLGSAPLDESLNAGDLAFGAALAAALKGVSLPLATLDDYIYDAISGNDLTGYGAVTFDGTVLEGSEMDNLLAAAGFDPADLGL